jgi:SpoIIAA-like
MVSIEVEEGALLHVRADGQLQAEDYTCFAPQLDRLVRRCGAPIPVLVELGPGLDGWRLLELWQRVEIDEPQRRLFGPMAVVGDLRWAAPTRVADDTFFAEPVRFFEHSDKAKAEDWLRENTTRAGAC